MSNKLLALSVPDSPIGLALPLRMHWEVMLPKATGYDVVNVYSQGTFGETRPEDVDALERADGLVIPCSREFRLDHGLRLHIAAMAGVPKPVFTEVPLKEYDPIAGYMFEEAEIITIGRTLRMINERLEGV